MTTPAFDLPATWEHWWLGVSKEQSQLRFAASCVQEARPQSPASTRTEMLLQSSAVEAMLSRLLDPSLEDHTIPNEAVIGLLRATIRAGAVAHSKPFADELFDRIMKLRAAFQKLQLASKASASADEFDSVHQRSKEAVVGSIAALKCRIADTASIAFADPATPFSFSARSGRQLPPPDNPADSIPDVTGDDDGLLFIQPVQSESFHTVGTPAMKVSNSVEELASLLHSSGLNAVKEHVNHRRVVASWTATQAVKQLHRYCSEKARDLEMRANLDTERGRLEAIGARALSDLQRIACERLEIEARRRSSMEASVMEAEAIDVALQHERGWLKLLDREAKSLQAKLTAVRGQMTSCENRTTALKRNWEVVKESADVTDQVLSRRVQHCDSEMAAIRVQLWTAKVSTAFVADIEVEAARQSSASLQSQEKRLDALVTSAAESVTEALERSKDLLARLSSGRNLLVDLLCLSPLSSSTLTESEPKGLPSNPEDGNFPQVGSATEVTTSSSSGMPGTNSAGQHRDVVLCGKDVLTAMSRIAAQAEDLHNVLGDIVTQWKNEEFISTRVDELRARVEAVYRDITTTLDATKDDALEIAFADMRIGTPRLSTVRSLEDLSGDDEHGASKRPLSLGAGKRGLPRKLARGRASASTLHSLPKTPGPKLFHEQSELGGSAWVSFISQFRQAFGGEAS